MNISNYAMNAVTTEACLPQPPWVSAIPELARISDPVWIEVANRAKQMVLAAGTEVFREGDSWTQFLFVTEGVLRVYKSFENGRELMLYRVKRGETCCMTTSVMFGGGHYTANAVTETETRTALLSTRDFHHAFNQSSGFRDFICATFGNRLGDFVTLLESVTMRQIDVRLAKWLVNHSDGCTSVDVSHRELACELGTAREVISRHLKDFESRGWVELGRKNIAFVDVMAMQQLACSQHRPGGTLAM